MVLNEKQRRPRGDIFIFISIMELHFALQRVVMFKTDSQIAEKQLIKCNLNDSELLNVVQRMHVRAQKASKWTFELGPP